VPTPTSRDVFKLAGCTQTVDQQRLLFAFG
jgi:hypothetical protein